MLRNHSRLLAILGAALLAGAPALHAQSGQPVRGDVDGDGKVTAADARIVSDWLVGRPVPPGADVAVRGDVNGDGRVTAVDAAIIARAAAGRDMSRFPVGAALPAGAVAVVECDGSVATSTVSCHLPGESPGARRDLIVGGQNVNVKLTSANILKVAPDTFQFTVTVQNLLPQAMGVDSGTGTPNANGVRVFFHTGPTVTGGSGSIAVVNHDGVETFLASNQKFFQYATTALGGDGILAPQEISSQHTWKLQYTAGVTNFSFLLFLSTPVQFPAGWVDIYPPSHAPSPTAIYADTMQAGQALQLQDTVRNGFGGVIPGPPVTWANTAHGHATVNGSGLVTAVSAGVDTVSATNGPRSGRVRIVVAAVSADSTIITANPTSIVANDSSLITVQVRDEFGHNITTGGATVTLTTNLGTLKGTAAPGTTVTAVDQGNGTYTAKLTGTTAGTATITGTLNGNPIGDNTTTVTIGPSTPALLSISAGDGQSALVGSTVTTAPKVHVQDAYGNAVPGVTITFSVTGGGGSTTGSTPVTGATGDASVGSWTLGSGPALNNLQASASPVGTTTPVTFTGYVPPNAVNDSSQAMGNTTIPSSVTPNALTNDATINGGAVSLVPASIGALTTDRGGTLTLAADGSFSYLPAAGIVGRDSVAYTVKDTHYTGPASGSSTSYIKLRFVGKVWYVDNTFGGAATGRDVSPFTSIGAAEAVAGVNDSVLVRTGSGTTTGGTLKNGQLVYAQGASSAFTTTINGNSLTLLSAGSAPNIGALTLGSGNTLRGFTAVGTITGSGFGTLTTAEVGLNTGATQALSLTTGTLAGGFTSLVSSGGTNNVLLSGVGTSGTSTLGASGNALSGATGDGVVITGGGGSFTFPGNVSNANSFAVNVNSKSGGTVTFSGNINPGGAARGISAASNTGGTVLFSGGTKAISSATAAGVTLTSNTGATIQFTGGGLTIATTTGTPFTATGGGTVEVTGSGNTISATGAAANAVNLSGITLGAGGMTFASIASSGTTTGSAFSAATVGNTSGSSFSTASLTVAGTTGGTSRGLAISTSSAPFTFTTASVNGTGGEGIYLNGNTATVAVNGGTVGNSSNTAGDALFVSGGSADVTVAASLAKTSAGRIANIGSHTAGNVTVSGSLSCTSSCTGISVASNSGGTIDFSNSTKTVNTGANAAVTLSSNTGATVNFTGGGLAITTSSGNGYSATGGGTVNVTGSLNTVSTAGGVGVNIQNTTIGASNVTFRSVAKSTGSAFGIRVENTGTSGGLKVTGDGSTANSGGILVQSATTAVDSAGVTLTGTTGLDLQFMRVSITTGSGASGIVASQLTGSNQVAKTSIDYNNTAPDAVPAHGAYGARLVQNSGAATMTFDAVSIANKMDGTTAGSLSAGGSVTVNFNVIDSNTGDSFNSNLSGLFGSGWVISSGDTGGSTGTVNVTISDTKFLNAAANGTNNLELGANASSTMNYKIKNNTFSAVANASFIAGIMNIQTFDTAVMGGTTAMDSITGNTITNSGTSAVVANLGYIGIRVALQSASATTHRMVINNNQITDLWRQGILLSTRQNATGHFKLTNNTIGTAALPVGQSNRRGLETDLQDNSVMNLEMTGNAFFNSGTSDSNAAVGLRVGTNSGSATLNATVVSNNIANSSAGTTARFRAESAATGTGTLCLDLRTNSLDAAAKTFGLLQTGGTYRVEAAGTGAVTNAQIQTANTVGGGNVSGTINNNNSTNCTQPPI